MAIIGIYKITSPTGRVYIGQSWDIWHRKVTYRCAKAHKQQKLNASLVKYGVDAHLFEIVHQLPKDVEQDVLDNYENLYMRFYREAGVDLMNLREGGSRGKHHPSTLLKISKAKKGVKPNISDKGRKRISDRVKLGNYAFGIKHTMEQNINKSKLMKESHWRLPSRKVLCLNNGEVYESQREAATKLGISYKHIPDVCNGKRNHVGGFKFKHI